MTLLEQVQKLAECQDSSWITFGKCPVEHQETLKRLVSILNEFNTFADTDILSWKDVVGIELGCGFVWLQNTSSPLARFPISLLTENTPEEVAGILGAKVAKVRLSLEKQNVLDRLEVIESKLKEIECILT